MFHRIEDENERMDLDHYIAGIYALKIRLLTLKLFLDTLELEGDAFEMFRFPPFWDTPSTIDDTENDAYPSSAPSCTPTFSSLTSSSFSPTLSQLSFSSSSNSPSTLLPSGELAPCTPTPMTVSFSLKNSRVTETSPDLQGMFHSFEEHRLMSFFRCLVYHS